MTDEIRITRWAQLTPSDSVKFEFADSDANFVTVEKRIEKYREMFQKQRPEISPKISQETIEQGDFMADLIKAGIDPSIIAFTANTAKLKTYQKDKTVWERIHFVLKEAGYKWIADGKDSRWER